MCKYYLNQCYPGQTLQLGRQELLKMQTKVADKQTPRTTGDLEKLETSHFGVYLSEWGCRQVK
jgi:hypothetical protein